MTTDTPNRIVKPVQFSGETYLDAIGPLDAREQGLYALVLARIAHEGGPIEEDHQTLATAIQSRPNHVEDMLADLVEHHRLTRVDGKLGQHPDHAVIKTA